jgi:plastocyanin
MFSRISAIAVATVTAASLLLAGCGGGGNNTIPAPKTPTGPETWVVQAGGSDQNEALQALQFYPSTITIDEGDSITWRYPAGEPHTVTFLGPKSAPPPPDDPSVPAPAGGSTYDGSTYTSSGFMLLGKTYTLTFAKAGTYTYYCLIHGEMAGKVVVQPKGTAYPMVPGSVMEQIPTALAADLKTANDAVAQFPYTAGGPHLAAGIAPGLANSPLTNASVVRFLDGDQLSDTSVTVAAGTTVTWTNLDTNNPHTVTFPVAGQDVPQMPPFSPPSGGTTYDGSTLVNSGPLFPGQSFSLTLTKPGTYTYNCLFHDDTENMKGTIVVK